MKKLLVLGMVLAFACAAFATYPTLTGPTGLISVPTAAVAPAGQFSAAMDWWYVFGDDDAIIPIRVLYGINDQLEIGANFVTAESGDNSFGVNAKFVLPFTAGDAAWAVGANFFDPEDGDSVFGASLSATKAFNETFNGTASLMWSEDGNGFIADIDGLASGDFALGLGMEATLDSGLVLVGEYVNFLPGAELNAAARYPLTEALTAQVGFTFNTSSPFIGASYAFGAAK